MKIVATVSMSVQIGYDTWKQVNTSKTFSTTQSIDDILTWAKDMKISDPDISDLQFSKYTEE